MGCGGKLLEEKKIKGGEEKMCVAAAVEAQTTAGLVN